MWFIVEMWGLGGRVEFFGYFSPLVGWALKNGPGQSSGQSEWQGFLELLA